MAKKSATKAVPATTPSIPSVQDDDFAALNDFRDPEAPVVTPKKGKANDKPEMQLPPATQELVKRFIPAQVLFAKVESYKKNRWSDVVPELYALWVDTMWKARQRPANPMIIIRDNAGKVDMQVQFIVQEKLSIDSPDVQSGEKIQDAYIRSFREKGGMSAEDAARFVIQEMEFEETCYIDVYSLLRGEKGDSPELAKSTGKKLMAALKGTEVVQFLPEERRLLMTFETPKATMKDGFLERVTTYCKSKEDLERLLALIVPTKMLKGAEFAKTCDEPEKKQRLMMVFEKIVGESKK